MYLNTPSGDDKVYDPASGAQKIISNPMRPAQGACMLRKVMVLGLVAMAGPAMAQPFLDL
jgi:hypothetical protein